MTIARIGSITLPQHCLQITKLRYFLS